MSDFNVMTLEDIEVVAASKGCTVRVARDNELMFDIDTKDAEVTANYFLAHKLAGSYVITSHEEWRSKSGNLHICVTLQHELPATERIALQAMGGSDIGREFASMQCLKAGSPHPILLFVPEVQS